MWGRGVKKTLRPVAKDVKKMTSTSNKNKRQKTNRLMLIAIAAI